MIHHRKGDRPHDRPHYIYRCGAGSGFYGLRDNGSSWDIDNVDCLSCHRRYIQEAQRTLRETRAALNIAGARVRLRINGYNVVAQRRAEDGGPAAPTIDASIVVGVHS